MSGPRSTKKKASPTAARKGGKAAQSPLDLGPLLTAEDYDWSDQRGARAARDALTLDPVTGAHEGKRLDRLIVIRESDRYNRALFDGALRQGWSRNSDAPDIEQVMKAGHDPLHDPESCPFDVVPIVGDHFRGAFFVVGNVGYVYSPGSAKTTNSAGDNEFTATLCALIIEYRPVVVDAVAFPRLVRSLDHGPRLGAVCGRNVDRVQAGAYVLDFKEHPEWAQLLWVILSAIASAERDEIQRHNTAGVLVKHSRGEWVLSAPLPLGYRYQQETGRIEWDPSLRETVEGMLRILVSGLPAATQVDELINIGVLPGPPANAGSAVRKLIRWSLVYVAGKWIQPWSNPVPGLQEWLGYPVRRRSPDDNGHFELSYDWGVPPGGWAAKPLLRDVVSLVRATRERRRGGKRGLHPLTGYRFDGAIGARRGRREWRITPYHDRYELRVRVAPK